MRLSGSGCERGKRSSSSLEDKNGSFFTRRRAPSPRQHARVFASPAAPGERCAATWILRATKEVNTACKSIARSSVCIRSIFVTRASKRACTPHNDAFLRGDIAQRELSAISFVREIPTTLSTIYRVDVRGPFPIAGIIHDSSVRAASSSASSTNVTESRQHVPLTGRKGNKRVSRKPISSRSFFVIHLRDQFVSDPSRAPGPRAVFSG